jgi:antirestriction protein ArdC
MKATDIYDQVTARIVDQLKHVDPRDWRMPWHGEAGLPYNAVTGRAYKGGNVIALWVAQLDKEYEHQTWATYKQWAGMGGTVRKGERATHLVKWVMPDEQKPDPDKKRRAFPYGFAVFNIAQVEGVEPVEDFPDVDPIEEAEAFFAGVGATVRRGDPAYWPARDVITMPARKHFVAVERYYAALAHEHVHWTGHGTRLDRDGIARHDGSATPQYAFEELVAELGSAFLGAQLGLEMEPREDHAQYIAGWITLLSNDNGALYRAASQAARAVGFLTDLGEPDADAAHADDLVGVA